MYRIGLAVLACLLLACNGNDDNHENTNATNGGGRSGFSSRFRTAALPFSLSDSSLLNNQDTATLSAQYLSGLVPDSIVKQVFGKSGKVKYTPLVKFEDKAREAYYLIKGTSGNKKAALLLVFDKDGNYAASIPFLVPDTDATTSQVSSIDKSYGITKAITQRSGIDVIGEGKEVLAYDANEKRFSLVMTDLLHDNPSVLVNPIDTFAKANKFAGDYYLNKKNLIAVRDGRYANQILVYIHTENSEGNCIGELKGEFLITGATTAVYRQGGDPCILGLTFSGNSVAINEESGCGNYRGLDCPFGGTFTRKKAEKPKETTKKTKRPKQAQ